MKTAILDISEQPGGVFGNRTLVNCEVDFDLQRGCWRATDDLGNEAFDDYANLAVLKCFALRLVPGGLGEVEKLSARVAQLQRARDVAVDAWERHADADERRDPAAPYHDDVRQRIAEARKAGGE